MNVSTERIASLHLAHLQKEASVTRGIEDLAKRAVVEDFRQKVVAVGKKKATKASNKGWAWVLKNEGTDLVQVIRDAKNSKSSFNSKDPLTRLLHMTLSKVSDPFEKNRIVGEFSEKYAKKDIEGMADVLGVDRDVVTITLLWYMRDVKVASKEARSKVKNRGKSKNKRNRSKGKARPRQRDPAPSSRRDPAPSSRRDPAPSSRRDPAPSSRRDPAPKAQGKPSQKPKGKNPVSPETGRPHSLDGKDYLDKQEYEEVKEDIREEFERYSGFTSKALRLASYITGGPAVEWLIDLLPRGEVLAKPAKWAWWAYLIKNSWTVISTVANWSSVAYNWLISISAKSLPMVSGFLKGLIGGSFGTWFAVAFVVLGCLVFVAKKVIQKSRTFSDVMGRATGWQKAKLGFFWVWNTIKSAISGVLNAGNYVRDEILDYVRDNASMFNYLIRKHDVDEDSAPPEINEALAEAS
jgi:hypothetical protein